MSADLDFHVAELAGRDGSLLAAVRAAHGTPRGGHPFVELTVKEQQEFG